MAKGDKTNTKIFIIVKHQSTKKESEDRNIQCHILL